MSSNNNNKNNNNNNINNYLHKAPSCFKLAKVKRLTHHPPFPRSVHDALCVVKRVLESKSVVPGGGAVEAAVSIYLENFASSLVPYLLRHTTNNHNNNNIKIIVINLICKDCELLQLTLFFSVQNI